MSASKTFQIQHAGTLLARHVMLGFVIASFTVVCEEIQGDDIDITVVNRDARYPRRIWWGAYDPYCAMTSRVYAQADLIRAQGTAAVDFALARNLHATAYSKELDNWLKELRVYWDRKITAEQKKLKLDHIHQIKKMRYLNDQKWRNSRVWDRLKNHAEMSKTQIENGYALNFLLAKLSDDALPYKFDPSTSRYAPEVLEELALDDLWLGHLTLKQGAFKFAANQAATDTISMWPYLLRWDEFRATRLAYETARAVVFQESQGGQASVDSIQGMQQSLMTLTQAFHGSENVKQWVQQHRRYSPFYSSDRFLQELDREIARLEETGDIRPFGGQSGYDPKTDGKHVVSLLCFMNRNGLEFAPANPGSEFAYHNLFVCMRALFWTVAEENESLKPQDLSELAK